MYPDRKTAVGQECEVVRRFRSPDVLTGLPDGQGFPARLEGGEPGFATDHLLMSASIRVCCSTKAAQTQQFTSAWPNV